MKWRLYVLLPAFAAFDTIRADEPLSVPARHVTNSTSGRFQVVSDPTRGTICMDTRESKTLWSISQWFRKLVVSDDGHFLVTEYDGLNLIPQDFEGKMVMITFWKDGEVLREVTLDELIPDKKILRKTVSHYAWGTLWGFRPDGMVEIRLVDDTRLLYDPKTGRRAEQAARKEKKAQHGVTSGSDKPSN